MPEPCEGPSMPLECAKRFEAGTQLMTELGGKIDGLAEQVGLVRRAVSGNSDPAKGIAFRVARLEDQTAEHAKTKRRWVDRAWKLFVAVTLAVLTLKMGGCWPA